MKRILILGLFSALATSAFALTDTRYQEAMKKNITAMDSAMDPAQNETLANNFERIGDAEKDQWLPYYYASLCRIKQAFQEKDKSKVDAIDDQAESLAGKADALSPDTSEMLCLRSTIASARIAVDPQNRGMKYGPLAGQLLEQAKKAAPGNPRVYLLEGQAAFYTPEQWGGGKDKAKPLLEEALAKYKTFTPTSDLSPAWGEKMATYLLSQCNQ